MPENSIVFPKFIATSLRNRRILNGSLLKQFELILFSYENLKFFFHLKCDDSNLHKIRVSTFRLRVASLLFNEMLKIFLH